MSVREPDFSTQLLDRFLVIAHSYDLEPSILVTKKDLASENEIEQINAWLKIYEEIGYNTQFVGKHTSQQEVVATWPKGLIVLSGQSGVGKSTFINAFKPELNLETNHISKSLNRGKHTTRHVELFERESGFIADTPGFSALDFGHIDKDELKHYFIEMNRFGEECKFRNCNHIKEPKCHVKQRIGKWLFSTISL